MSDKTHVLIIAGHSHTAAVIGAHGSEPGVRLLPVPERDRVYGLHESWVFGFPIRSDDYWSALAEHASGNSIALLYTGNEHNSNFLFEQRPYFDLVPRGLERLPVEADADVVPETLVRAKFRALVEPAVSQLISRLKARGPLRLALIGSPPPPRHYMHAHEEKLPEGVGVRQTSPTKMLKLWQVLQAIFRETAEKNDIEFVPALEIASDADGFLKDEFSGTDVTHANQAYGRMLLDRLTGALLRC